MQPGQVSRKRGVAARLAALVGLGRPRPSYKGFKLLSPAMENGLAANFRNTAGTVRRVLQGPSGPDTALSLGFEGGVPPVPKTRHQPTDTDRAAPLGGTAVGNPDETADRGTDRAEAAARDAGDGHLRTRRFSPCQRLRS